MSRKLLVTAMLGALSATLGTGCSLPLFDLNVEATNTCTTDSDCGDGVCASVDGAPACVATSTDLGSVIVEVRPAADAKGNTVSHVFADSISLSGTSPQGLIQSADLQIPPKVTFSGQVTATVADATCAGVDGSVPTKVELHSVSAFAGLNETYTTSATYDAAADVYRYSIDVPAGKYDVYLKSTTPTERPDCALGAPVPRFVPNVDVSTSVDFTTGSEPPARLSGSLLVPKDRSVAGWRLEIVDNLYGLLLSDTMELADPIDGSASIQILGGPVGDDPLGLRFYYTGDPIIRLRDANGTLVVHWLLSGVDIDKDSKVDLDLADLVADPLPIEASIVDGNAQGVAASVTIESVLLSGTAKQNASFRVLTSTDTTGSLFVNLVPGEYRVSIAPTSDDTLATVSDKWSVSTDNLGHGKAFVLPKRPFLNGTVESAGGDPLPSMPLVAAASSPDALDYFSQTVDVSKLLPRQASVTTDTLGKFSLAVDPGTIDLSVQPSASSLFPWLVLPRLLVDTAENKPILDVDTLTLPSPVILQGTVSSNGTVVPFAVVRVLLPLPANGASMGSPVIQIGEAITDENGRYTLPLPPSISTSSAKSSASK